MLMIQRDVLTVRWCVLPWDSDKMHTKWRVLYPEVTKVWQRQLPYLMTISAIRSSLVHPFILPSILERFIKKVRRRTRVIEVFPHPDATGKVMCLGASEMNERYQRRLLRNWYRINEKLQSITMVKYGNKAMVDAFCFTQNNRHYARYPFRDKQLDWFLCYASPHSIL
jgi:hypothetical protein